jgi:Domain of unknown function (DUF4340)
MARQSQILSIVLVLQIALAAILFFTDTDSGAFIANEKLLDLNYDALEKIVIEESGDKTLVLQKQDKTWKLPGYFDFPASGEKLDRVFGKLFETQVGWPVATTESAEKRFKVAANEFERKLAFSTAGANATLYLGTSPGFKKIHARIDGENSIYGVDFSAYQASTKPIDWADQTILQVPRAEIEAIEIAGLALNRSEDKFVIAGLAAGEEAVESEVQSLVTSASTIGFQEVLGKTADPSYQLDPPVLDLIVVKKGGERITYRYGKLKDQEDFVLKPSNSEFYFKVAKYNVERLQGVDRSKLVKAAAPKAETENTPAGSASPVAAPPSRQ